MKNFFKVFLLGLMFLTSTSLKTVYDFSKGSVLKPGVDIINTSPERKFIPFMDLETTKIGFLRTDYTIAVPPTYENADNRGFLLLPVQKNGKWGVMDLGLRYYVPGSKFNDPLIPCKYGKIEVRNDYIVVCDGKIIDIRDLGYEEY